MPVSACLPKVWRLSGIEPACAAYNAMHLYTTNLSPSLRAVPHTPKAYSPRTYRAVVELYLFRHFLYEVVHHFKSDRIHCGIVA